MKAVIVDRLTGTSELSSFARHPEIESTVRCPGIEVDDPIETAERVDG